MQETDGGRYRILGGPGSPYSIKLRAVFRYRRIPHNWIVPTGYLGSAGELAAAGKGMIPVLQLPDGRYWADTTPMILALEERHPGHRSVLPEDPGHRFLARLIEDFGDEWLVQPFFDYRWDAEEDQAFCSRRQMAGWLGAMPRAEFDAAVAKFRARQTAMLARLGDRDLNRPLLRLTYRETLAAIEAQVDETRFLFGARPSIGDFGLFGQLSQCVIDPSAASVIRRDAARAFQWVYDLDDASGVDGAWRATGPDQGPGVERLMTLISDVYLPYLVANAQAVAAGEPDVSLDLRGMPYRARAASYRADCLVWLKLALRDAIAAGATWLEPYLQARGCWDALQLAQGEADGAAPLSRPRPPAGGRR